MGRFRTSRWLLVVLPLSGCDGCREKPYTPFGVTSALPHASEIAPTPSASAEAKSDAGASTVRKAALAPDNAKQWQIGGMALVAPAGRVFEQALVSDFDANGAEDVVSWTLPEPGAPADAAPGELWFHPAGAEARRLLEYPSFLPTGGTCTSVAALSASTKSSVTLDVRVSCSTRLVGRAATRALAVIEPFATTPLRFGVRAADPAPDEVLTLDLVPHDEDSDGRNDFGLRVGVGSKAAPPEVFALFQFLDRAAGVSRDATQPSRSLLESLKKDTSRSLKKKTADAALLHVEQTRRLLGSACAEGATARVFDWSGTPLSCAPLQDVVDRLAAIEVSAELTRGEVGRALAALGRDGWYFGAARKTMRSQLLQDIEKRVTAVATTKVDLAVRPKRVVAPARAPIGFSDDGTLWLETGAGLMQVRAGELRAEAASEEAASSAWPNEVSLPSGERWIGATYSCDRSEVSLLIAGAASTAVVPLLAPRPGVCAGGRFSPHFAPVPAALQPSFEVVLGGLPLSAGPAQSFPAGVARSPDGKWLAIPTLLGLWLQGETSVFWKTDGFSEVAPEACVVSNRAERVACVRANKVELFVKAQ